MIDGCQCRQGRQRQQEYRDEEAGVSREQGQCADQGDCRGYVHGALNEISARLDSTEQRQDGCDGLGEAGQAFLRLH